MHGRPPSEVRKKDEKRFDAGSWILTTVLAVAIVWSPLEFSHQAVSGTSGSMVPVINPGDVVIVAPVQTDAIKVGEIIEYAT